MDIFEALYSRRTIRKFSRRPIDTAALYKLIDCAHLAPSAANLQPIKYAVINTEEMNEKIFPLIKWAGYEPKAGPNKGEEPAAYIAVLGDDSISKPTQDCDSGLAMAAICYAAEGMGLGSCILGAIDRKGIGALLELGENLHVLYLIALGYPAQESAAINAAEGMAEGIKYYLNGDKLYVPKRTADQIIINYQEK